MVAVNFVTIIIIGLIALGLFFILSAIIGGDSFSGIEIIKGILGQMPK